MPALAWRRCGVWTRMVFARIVLLVTALTLAADGTSAATGTASEFMARLGDQAITVLRTTDADLDAREALFRSLLRQGFDLAFM